MLSVKVLFHKLGVHDSSQIERTSWGSGIR